MKKLGKFFAESPLGDILEELAAILPEEYAEPVQEVRPECDLGEMSNLEKAAFTWIYRNHIRIQKQASSMSAIDSNEEQVRFGLVENMLFTSVRLRLPQARVLGIGFGKGFRVIRDHEGCPCEGCRANRRAQEQQPSLAFVPWSTGPIGEA